MLESLNSTSPKLLSLTRERERELMIISLPMGLGHEEGYMTHSITLKGHRALRQGY
jgi:hypothetical protein